MENKNLAKKNQAGFSLIELVVSMVLFLIVTGTIYGLLEVGRDDRNRASRKTDVSRNARMAMQLIGRDALNAGLGYHRFGALIPDNVLSTRLGITADADTQSDILTSVVAGNNSVAVGSTPTDTIAFAFRDLDFNGGQAITITDATSSNSMLLLTGPSAALANIHQYDVFLAQADTTQVALVATAVSGTQVTFAVGDPLGINQSYSLSLLKKCTVTVTTGCVNYAVPVTLKRFYWVSYKVKPDGTLVRITYGNNVGATATQQIVEQPLVYGIKNMQFNYTLDDGTVVADPSVGTDGIFGTLDDVTDKLNKVRLLSVSLTVESSEAEAGDTTPDVFTINSSYSTRNLDYDTY